MNQRSRTNKRSPSGKSAKPKSRARRPFVIDFHAHVIVPEVAAFARPYTVAAASDAAPKGWKMSAAALAKRKRWTDSVRSKMADFKVRLRDMDKTGVDVQVLTASLVSQFTYWADPRTSWKMERLNNERIAEICAAHPDRFVGLGGVPLTSPKLAVRELERCVAELGLKGVQISSTAGDMELGDARLRPFWAKAEKLDAAIYLHPAGITEPRYQKHQLWNSIGQPLEESMAMASLFYEGVVDEFPKLKICVAHGGGYLPFYPGRVDRNYFDKPYLRQSMKRSPSEYIKKSFYYDTCVYDADMLDVLIRTVGASRIVMGSDYPVGEADPVGFVHKAKGLSAADKARILSGNAAKMLGLAI